MRIKSHQARQPCQERNPKKPEICGFISGEDGLIPGWIKYEMIFARALKSARNRPMIGLVALCFGIPQAGQGLQPLAGANGGLTSIRIFGGKGRHIMMKVQK
jgi:hypothetical protein